MLRRLALVLHRHALLFLAVLNREIYKTHDGNQNKQDKHRDCSHDYSSCFLSLTNQRPVKSVDNTAAMPKAITIHCVSIMPKIDDNTTAVATYLSYVHQPFSEFFLRLLRTCSCPQRYAFPHVCITFAAIFRQKACTVQIFFSPLRCLTFITTKAADDPPNSRAGFFVSLRLAVYAYLMERRGVCLFTYRVPPLVERQCAHSLGKRVLSRG